jgi:hypothetical protein
VKTYKEIIDEIIPVALEKSYYLQPQRKKKRFGIAPKSIVYCKNRKVSARDLENEVQEAGLNLKDFKGRCQAVLASDQLHAALKLITVP